MRKAMQVLVILGLIAGLLAGCGDGDDGAASGANGSGSETTTSDSGSGGSNPGGSSSDSTDTSSDESEPQDIAKAEFVKRANGVCDATIAKITSQILPALEKEAGKPGYDREAQEIELVETVAVPAFQDEVTQIRSLGIPPGDEGEVEAILASFDKLIEEIEADPKTLVGTNKAFEKPANLAESYGLKSCPYG